MDYGSEARIKEEIKSYLRKRIVVISDSRVYEGKVIAISDAYLLLKDVIMSPFRSSVKGVNIIGNNVLLQRISISSMRLSSKQETDDLDGNG